MLLNNMKINIFTATILIFSLSLFSCEGLESLVEDSPSTPSYPTLTFTTDTDWNEDQICGVLTLTEPEMEDNISSYRIYWGTAESSINLICELNKHQNPLEYTIAENTGIPAGATHFIAQSVTADGIVSRNFSLDIEDIVIERISDIKAGDVEPFSSSSSEFYIIEYNGYLYFNGGDDSSGNGAELWRYDGINPPSEFIDINSTGSSYPGHFCVYNNRLYFAADGGDGSGNELWCYDGLTVTRISDIYSSGDSNPSYLKVYNNILYFAAESSWSVKKLYRYNGSGTPEKICDINSSGSSDDISYLEVFNNRLYFQANDGSSGKELWSYDGVSVIQVADMNSSVFVSFNPSYMTAYNGELYFRAESDMLNHGEELWACNGTADPYEKYDIYSGFTGSRPKYMTTYNGKLYFQGVFSGQSGAEFLCYDGINSPYLVADIDSTSGSSNPECFTVFNGKLYFYVKSTASSGLWVFFIK